MIHANMSLSKSRKPLPASTETLLAAAKPELRCGMKCILCVFLAP
jgi:hypothetical protein